MTWVKLDDKSPRHPKIAGLSDKAFRVWISGLCYASEFLTDGVLPSPFLSTIRAKIREELLSSGLWKLSESGLEVSIHDYLKHQTSRANIEIERASARERRANVARTLGERSPNVGDQKQKQKQIQKEEERPSASAPLRVQPLIRKRNLHAAFEHPRFDVPQWWHDEKVRGLSGGESRIAKFYDWLSARVERTNEDTEPRKAWLNAAFEVWLAETSAPKSAYPTPEDTRRMIAEREAMAGK